ncbi:hypothetical protein B0H15DRAFT_934042 [Mycena belliarum]|uniref:Uncharacterized protein n=1 Tax=Mycena belliarum TaxID=1033014 RepID=A0AAD6TUZ5_9AGAR|nr:hypothetical protein B0H15DRAFT_934042 [Mycena belliae]
MASAALRHEFLPPRFRQHYHTHTTFTRISPGEAAEIPKLHVVVPARWSIHEHLNDNLIRNLETDLDNLFTTQPRLMPLLTEAVQWLQTKWDDAFGENPVSDYTNETMSTESTRLLTQFAIKSFNEIRRFSTLPTTSETSVRYRPSPTDMLPFSVDGVVIQIGGAVAEAPSYLVGVENRRPTDLLVAAKELTKRGTSCRVVNLDLNAGFMSDQPNWWVLANKLTFDIPSGAPDDGDYQGTGRDHQVESEDSSSYSNEHDDKSAASTPLGVTRRLSSRPTEIVSGSLGFTGDWSGCLANPAGYSITLGDIIARGAHGVLHEAALFQNGVLVSVVAVKRSDITEVLADEFSVYEQLEPHCPYIPRCFGLCISFGTAFLLVTKFAQSRILPQPYALVPKSERCLRNILWFTEGTPIIIDLVTAQAHRCNGHCAELFDLKSALQLKNHEIDIWARSQFRMPHGTTAHATRPIASLRRNDKHGCRGLSKTKSAPEAGELWESWHLHNPRVFYICAIN